MSNMDSDFERCAQCGKIITTIGEYCPNCGAKLFGDMNIKKQNAEIEKKNDGLGTCPDCGKPVSTKAVTCPHCGAPLIEEEQRSNEQGEKKNNAGANVFFFLIGTALLIWGIMDMMKVFGK